MANTAAVVGALNAINTMAILGSTLRQQTQSENGEAISVSNSADTVKERQISHEYPDHEDYDDQYYRY